MEYRLADTPEKRTPRLCGYPYNQDTSLVPKGVRIIGVPLYFIMHACMLDLSSYNAKLVLLAFLFTMHTHMHIYVNQHCSPLMKSLVNSQDMSLMDEGKYTGGFLRELTQTKNKRLAYKRGVWVRMCICACTLYNCTVYWEILQAKILSQQKINS